MKHKIVIFQTHLATGKGGGIKVYCEAVRSLFRDDNELDVTVCPILPVATRFFGNKFNINDIENYLNEEKPDILHINGYANMIVSQLVSLGKKRGLKIVYTPHWHPFETMSLSVLKKLHFNFFVRPWLDKVDAIVNINKEENSFFKQYSDRTFMIPHWNLGKYRYDDSIKKEPSMILFVGNLFYKNKGAEYLYYLPENKYDIHFVGRGKMSLRRDMTQHQNISDNELNKLYNRASLVVIPSRYEAFSYTALEAMTCGTPIVVSNNVRFADFIDRKPECSVFEYGNAEDFVSKVENTIGVSFDPEDIVARFSPEMSKKNYKKLYLSLIK